MPAKKTDASKKKIRTKLKETKSAPEKKASSKKNQLNQRIITLQV